MRYWATVEPVSAVSRTTWRRLAMSDEEYPLVVGEYKGFTIRKSRSFTQSRLVARRDDEVHTQIFGPGNPHTPDEEQALESLKKHIDRHSEPK